MGWQNKSVMEQKVLFIKMHQSGDYTMTALCNRFGISRTTGHKLVKRFEAEGESCLRENSRAPRSTPHKTPKNMENAIIKLRIKHPDWGARKLRVLLEKKNLKENIPSETTISAILKRNNLITSKRRRNPKEGKLYPKFDPAQPNEIWSADYKGKFKIGNKRYCWPLTICDSNSRIILDIRCHYKPDYKSVKQAYIRVFREYGLPQFLHTDNGTPFGSMRSPRRFSQLCYWLIDQGITPVFSDPASPQQNGRHERMHKDLKAYCRHKIQNTLSKQQSVMDDFVKEYNTIRPHESLNMKTPSEIHIKSKRQYREKKIPYEYPLHYKVTKVCINGAARWGAYNWLFISRAARGRYIAAEERANGIWNVYYRDVLLGYIDEKLIDTKETYLHIQKIKV
jgi:transposase InsO family protein